jgi:hypothetical protein
MFTAHKADRFSRDCSALLVKLKKPASDVLNDASSGGFVVPLSCVTWDVHRPLVGYYVPSNFELTYFTSSFPIYKQVSFLMKLNNQK